MNEFNYTTRVQQALDLANQKAKNFGHSYIGTEHLLLGVVAVDDSLLIRCGVDPANVLSFFEKSFGDAYDGPKKPVLGLTDRATKSLRSSQRLAKTYGLSRFDICDMYYGLFNEVGSIPSTTLRKEGLRSIVLKSNIGYQRQSSQQISEILDAVVASKK